MYYTNQHIRDQTKCCGVSYTYVVYMHLYFFWNNIYHVLYNNKSSDFNNCISIMADKFSLDICHDSHGDHVVHHLSSHPHPVLWYSVKIWFSCFWERHTKILILELFAEWWLLTCAFECVMAYWQLFYSIFNWLHYCPLLQASRILQKLIDPVTMQEASVCPSEVASGDESSKSELSNPVSLVDYSNMFGEEFQLPNDQWDSNYLNILDLGAVEEGILHFLYACASQVNYINGLFFSSLHWCLFFFFFSPDHLDLSINVITCFLSLHCAVNLQGELQTFGLHYLWYKHYFQVEYHLL